MSKNKTLLGPKDKQLIADLFKGGEAQGDLAIQFAVSRRTIQRALIEMGVLKHNEKKPRLVTQEEEDILTVVRRKGLNPQRLDQYLNSPVLSNDAAALLAVTSHFKIQDAAHLERALGSPALTEQNVMRFLVSQKNETLMHILYTVLLARVKQMDQAQTDAALKQTTDTVKGVTPLPTSNQEPLDV